MVVRSALCGPSAQDYRGIIYVLISFRASMEITSSDGQAFPVEPLCPMSARGWMAVAIQRSCAVSVTLCPLPRLHVKRAHFLLGMMLSLHHWRETALWWRDIFGAVHSIICRYNGEVAPFCPPPPSRCPS